MLTLDTLNVMLAVSEEGLIEEVVITLLASPQLAAFFEKFPKLRKAMTDDLPRWRDNLRQRFKETEVPPELTEEVAGYQQCQRLSTPQFIAQLQQTLTLLDNVHSPFASQARALVTDNPSFTPALHTLFLQRWRLSLVVQATSLNQQLLDEEREQLLSEVQERMTLSGQLEQVLVENENAAGRLWDMSAGQLKRGDYQLIVKYGDFLQNSLVDPGRPGQFQRKMRRWKPFVRWYASPPPYRSRWTAYSKAMISCACCLRNSARWE